MTAKRSEEANEHNSQCSVLSCAIHQASGRDERLQCSSFLCGSSEKINFIKKKFNFHLSFPPIHSSRDLEFFSFLFLALLLSAPTAILRASLKLQFRALFTIFQYTRDGFYFSFSSDVIYYLLFLIIISCPSLSLSIISAFQYYI